jgi:phosphate:Na+ symporter
VQNGVILNILMLIGSLVLFLFGMKLMSEALQRISGSWLRNLLNKITRNKFSGLMSGLLLTSIIQSSSATTVLVVSFVHAGLLSFAQSISVILGANIGTTITAWMISILGFNFNISIMALPLLALSFPLIFAKNSNKKSWGEVIVGFAVLFIGLGFLKQYLPNINNNINVIEYLSNYTDLGYYSILIFTGIGIIITLIVQSSSATIALTFVMCSNGWISFELAAAMILGENIGTTLTANIAAIVANMNAKRAAFSHFVVNFLGVIIALILFKPFIIIIDLLITQFGMVSPQIDNSTVPVSLSLFHTLFNVLMALLFINFIPSLDRFTHFIFKDSKADIEDNTLKLFQTGILSTSELSLINVRKALIAYSQIASNMFNQLSKLLYITDDRHFKKEYKEIRNTEEKMDLVERQIAEYLTKIGEKDLSISASKEIRAYLKISDNIESIADSCYNISKALRRKLKNQIWFTPEQRNQIENVFVLVSDLLNGLNKQLKKSSSDDEDLRHTELLVNKVNNITNTFLKDLPKRIKSKEFTYQSGVVFSDIISLCETICAYALNVSQALQVNNREEE